MKLTPAQHQAFNTDGYLFFPGLFQPEEVHTLLDAVPALYARREAYNVREKGSDAVRTNFAAHLYSAPFARLARHPRMVLPVQELLHEKLSSSEPMRTGMTALRLSIGKALVPFAFVFAPSLQFIIFTWLALASALFGAEVAIMGLGAADTGYVAWPLSRWVFWALNVLSVSLVFNHPVVTAVAGPLVLAILAWYARRA